MKKWIFALVLILAIQSAALGAMTVTQTWKATGPEHDHAVWTLSWSGAATSGTGDATAASTAITAEMTKGWYVYFATTIPSGATDNYDVWVYDSDSVDVFGGTLLNRDTSNKEQAVPKIDTTNSIYGSRFINGALTVTVSNQNVSGASGSINIYLYR